MINQVIYCLLIATCFTGCSQRQAAPHQASNQRVAGEKAIKPESDSMVAHYLKSSLNASDKRDEGVVGESVWKLYDQNNFLPVWISGKRLSPTAEEALLLISSAEAYGLNRSAYQWSKLQALQKEISSSQEGSSVHQLAAEFDLLLTREVMTFAVHLYQGKLRATAQQTADGSNFSLLALMQQALKPGNTASAFFRETLLKCQPASREYRLLQKGLAQWLRTPASPDSVIQRQEQYQQVAINLERWRSEPILDTEYILINIPAYQLQVVSRGEVIQNHRVIVGKSTAPTPTLSSQIGYFTTSPDWHVPRSIAVKEMLPRIKRNPGYLAENNLHLYDRTNRLVEPSQVDWSLVTEKNFAYSIQQSAGCDNALGNMVFNFPNPYEVYLHDTPNRNLFTRQQRALSHGCIRLENPMLMAQLLLQRDARSDVSVQQGAAQQDGSSVSFQEVEDCVAQQVKRQFNLKRPMPIHIRYLTVSSEGEALRFYKDIYGLDESLLNAFNMMLKASQE